jgi:hypothetical protein
LKISTTLTSADRERLSSILGMLGSNASSQRANAAAAAGEFRRDHHLTWAEMLAPALEPVAAPTPPEPPPAQKPPPPPPATPAAAPPIIGTSWLDKAFRVATTFWVGLAAIQER